MKIKFLTGFAFFCVAISSNAQWNNTGLNNGAVGNTIGTFNPFSMQFYTSSVQRMHINQPINNNINGQGLIGRDGFVGIGAAAGFYPNVVKVHLVYCI